MKLGIRTRQKIIFAMREYLDYEDGHIN